jgi:hypothetical protein
MTAYQIVFAALALSLPIVTLIAIGRQLWSIFRSLRTGHFKFAALSTLGIAGVFAIFAAALVLWFGYGVGHSKKSVWTDLLLIAVTGIPIYAAAYGLWRLARLFDARNTRDLDTRRTETGSRVFSKRR